MTALAQAIKKVATGPHLSKDLTAEEAQMAMQEVLSGQADEVQAAIFLIALRMKRETNDENLGLYRALQQVTEQITLDVPQLLLMADPFNGYKRHCPIHAFLPAVLSAAGLPTLSQGVPEMGPKFGVTHSQVLRLAGIDVALSTKQAALQLSDPAIAWAYLDQSQSTPALFALQNLRTKMIKRPSLATLEKIIMPIKALGQTHLQIGFVHKAYPDVLAWLTKQAGFDSALIIRGLEGGVLPTLREPSHCFQSFQGQAEAYDIDPAQCDITQTSRGVSPTSSDEATASETLALGLAALKGQSGAAFDSLVLGTAIALSHCGLAASLQQGADTARTVLHSGLALAHFEQAMG